MWGPHEDHMESYGTILGATMCFFMVYMNFGVPECLLHSENDLGEGAHHLANILMRQVHGEKSCMWSELLVSAPFVAYI
jgi:hypothetical protein